MKKTYIYPTMECVNIEPSRFLCESMDVNGETTKGFGDSLAPELPGFSDDELFQLFLIK